jgi:hypothetical protein
MQVMDRKTIQPSGLSLSIKRWSERHEAPFSQVAPAGIHFASRSDLAIP